ncbi:hypothetical protein CMQ_312 [Grosmannia clavigera kw1407]|uniref:Squalene phytoene synthase n=1 Tax=Grosmannia clavigera (strain kw1407 / UAMH 11150) TaxID=655863 RepID=F0XR16_GROCL|nr:uncharacterized protein CMQ_312 [Grosmannia clavigera kw1407]EFW99994.1 hypothetical protein CMQ_312 [Grosmannia clavigera kw1407]
MLCVRSSRHALRRLPSCSAGLRRSFVSDADVAKARLYCENQLKTSDHDAHLVHYFLPGAARDVYLALRTLNLELARLPETVTNPTIRLMRLQFWRDAVNNTFDGHPPREPVSLMLYAALAALAARDQKGASWSSIKFWLQRYINSRQEHMDNRPFPHMAALEDYAESTYATLMYITLAMLPLQSMHVDHLASHVGKAYGIAAILRSIPVLAAPAAPKSTAAAAAARTPVLLLPLDVMADVDLREEDVYRQGPGAPGLQEAVFRVATRANDHLITAREMVKNIRAGEDPGHDYEHAGETGHTYHDARKDRQDGGREGIQALKRGFGVLLEAVPAQDFLARIEAADFDPFRVKSSWKLPWSLYWAQKTHRI